MKTKLNKTVKKSIAVYGDGLRELLCDMGVPEKEWDSVWSEDDNDENPELQWLIGWFAGVAETLGVRCEELITLHEAKTPVKKTKAKKKTPVKRKKTPASRQAIRNLHAGAITTKKKTPVRALLPARRQAA